MGQILYFWALAYVILCIILSKLSRPQKSGFECVPVRLKLLELIERIESQPKIQQNIKHIYQAYI